MRFASFLLVATEARWFFETDMTRGLGRRALAVIRGVTFLRSFPASSITGMTVAVAAGSTA